MRKRLAQMALKGLLVLAVASVANAQQAPQPVVRLSNFTEVGNDVFMHIMASADIRYRTTTNYDFDNNVRDRTPDRSPSSTASQEGESDLSYAELRLGVEARYQKNLTLYLLFEHQQIFTATSLTTARTPRTQAAQTCLAERLDVHSQVSCRAEARPTAASASR